MGIADIIRNVGQASKIAGGDSKPVDVIEFAESDWGLGKPDPVTGKQFRLFPIQKIILKIHYGLELDDNEWGVDLDQPVPLGHPAYDEITNLIGGNDVESRTDDYGYYAKRIKVTDWRRKNVRYMTEAEYLRYLYKEGRSNIDKVDGERRELILSIGRRSGKCVVGDTLVLTERGLVRIDSLGDIDGDEIQVLQIGVAQEGQSRSRSSHFYNGGVRDTVSFRTKCGFRLEGTPNHRVKVMTPDGIVDWKNLGDISVNDVIAIHRATDFWPGDQVDVSKYHSCLGSCENLSTLPNVVDERWGLLLGCLVGGGSWTVHAGIDMPTDHSEHSREFLCHLGFRHDVESHTRTTPWVILQSPKSVVQAYLQGLFETDGFVDAKGTFVSFRTASERLAHETQLLLLNLGVVSAIRIKHKHDRNYYDVVIRGFRSRETFAALVGFRSHRKQSRLLGGVREGEDAGTIPHQKVWVQKLLTSVTKGRDVRDSGSGVNWIKPKLRGVLGNTCTGSMTYSRLARVLACASSLDVDSTVVDHFRHLAGLDYFYDSVVDVGYGSARVYDLSVPEGVSFVAAGMTNHNTLIASVISAYETYKMLLKHNPHSYYGVVSSNPIHIVSVATDKEQAGLLYKEVSGHFQSCTFFSTYMAHSTQSYASFQTPHDIDKYGRYEDNPLAVSSIIVTFKSCIAKSVRGMGIIVAILDEMAHFNVEGQSSASEVYDAIRPATAAYSQKHVNDSQKAIGPVESRIVAISSPMGRQGKFYELFQAGMKGGSSARNMLCIQAPTWEVNPTIPASEFEDAYMKDPNVFDTEFGGEFSDRTRGWLERKQDLYDCIDITRRPNLGAPARMPHFLGLDLALVNDYTGIAIGHLEKSSDRGSVIVVDYVDRIHAGEGKYEHRDRLEFDDVVDWIYQLSRKFYIAHGVFDQHCGLPFEQAVAKRGLTQLKMTHFTDVLNSDSFKNFKDLMWNKQLVLYDWPIPEGREHCDYIDELCELQAEQKTKNIIRVCKPNVDGKSDDMSDALVRMVWLAAQHMASPKYITGTHSGGAGVNGSGSYSGALARAMASARKTGSSPDRQQHRSIRGRVMGR